MAELRTEAHISERGNICPACNSKDSIVFQVEDNRQQTLTGDTTYGSRKLCKPYCRICGKSFSKGTYFKKMR
jgi:uncharacterized protein with PIN domain